MKTRGLWTRIALCFGVAVLMPALISLSSRTAGQLWRSTAVNQSKAASEAPEVIRAKDSGRWVGTYGKLPLSFEENLGQTAREVRFVSHGSGYELFLTPQEAVLSLRGLAAVHDLSPRHRFATLRAIREARRAAMMSASVVRLRLEGETPAPQMVGLDPLPGKVNYFAGNNPKSWHTDVPTYARVKYTAVYPGVDLIFYGNQRRLEYDFVVAPGADPKAIQLKVEGARKLRIDSQGNVVLGLANGEMKLEKPVVYQEESGERREIAGNYALAGNGRVRFEVSKYDRSAPLIVDPVLIYSTYLGGTADDQGLGIAVDSLGDAFVAGTTFSTDFPTTSSGRIPGPLASNAGGAAFVTELNPTGTALLYSTYLAGSTPGEIAFAVAVDSTGKIYVTGQTFSTDFPTTIGNALKPGPLASNPHGTSFISKIDPSLSGANSLVYSSYLGGTDGTGTIGDLGQGIAVDTHGNAYVAGLTVSTPGTTAADFPVMNAFQGTLNDAANGNAFLTRIDTTQSGSASLIYSTYLGGTGAHAATAGFGDAAFGVAIDTSNNAYVVGTTSSTDFPTMTTGFQQPTPHAGNVSNTAFVSRIDTTKSGNASLIYSTYLGGEAPDFGQAIALKPTTHIAYVTGETSSLLFPTTSGAFQTTGHATGNAFISLVDTSLTGSASLDYSTFLGGTGGDNGLGIAVDALGSAYVAGGTSSSNFPVTPGTFQKALASGAAGDGFVTKLNPGGNGAADLIYSTYFGGSASGIDQAAAIAIDTPKSAYITGQTFSSATTFPVTAGVFQTSLKGTADAFVAKLSLIPTVTVSPASLSFGTQIVGTTSAPQTVTLTNNGTAAVLISITSPIAVSGGSPAAANADFAIASNTCGSSVAAGAQCTVGVTFKPSVAAAETATLVFTDSDGTSPQNVALSGTGTNATPDFSVSATSSLSVTQGASGNFTVTVTPVNGFNQAVSLACTGAPAMATCTPSPASVTSSDGKTAVTSTVTVSTTAPSVVAPPSSTPTSPLSMRQVVPLLLALVLLLLLPRTQRRGARLALAGAMVVFLAVAGCGGGGHTKTGGTPKGSSNLTITGTSGNLTHSATVTLTVN
jgi:hypothetical protein